MRAHSSRKVILTAMGLAIGLAGCASGGGGSSSRPAGASSSRIVEAELEALGPVDAYQAVERLRPRWLQMSRAGAFPQIYIDGARRDGGIEILRTIRVQDIRQVQLLTASDATTRYGTGHASGAIMVSMR